MNKSYVLNALLAIFSALAAAPATAQTTDYPNRPVRIIVPQTAGGAVDIVARAIAQKLSESWGQQVIIDNRPGANGIIGMEAVAKAKPDGYTLGAPFTSVLAINPFVYKTLPYDAFRDFAPVMQSVANVIVLVVHPSLPVRSVKDLVALGKSRPGDLVYGSFGVGNLTHLAGELLRMETKMKMVHVPYKGETPAVTDLIGGQYVLLFSTSAGVFAHIKEGRLRLLATGGEKSAAAYPNAPTMAEAGLQNFPDNSGWWGLYGPAGMPAPIAAKITAALDQAMQREDVKQRLYNLGVEISPASPQELDLFLKSQLQDWRKFLKDFNIQPEN